MFLGIHITWRGHPNLERVVTNGLVIGELFTTSTKDYTAVEEGFQFWEICRRQSNTYALHTYEPVVWTVAGVFVGNIQFLIIAIQICAICCYEFVVILVKLISLFSWDLSKRLLLVDADAMKLFRQVHLVSRRLYYLRILKRWSISV